MSSPPQTNHDQVPLNLYRVSSPGTAGRLQRAA